MSDLDDRERQLRRSGLIDDTQVWDVCLGFDSVGTVEADGEGRYWVSCSDSDETDRFGGPMECWASPEGYESLSAAVDALSDHRYAVHVTPEEQHLDEVFSVIPDTPEAWALRRKLGAMVEEADPDQP